VDRYAGKVAIVSGATSGIGVDVARRLLEEGASVVLGGRSQERGAALVRELGERASFAPGDLTAAETPSALVQAALDRHGRLDLLVNNAALDHVGDLLETPLAEVRELFEVNVFAALALLQAAAQAMRGRGGAIVNVTSRLAVVGVPTMSLYAASKGALLSLTRAAAVELAPLGVRVNAVAPGMTRTEMFRAWLAGHEDPDGVERATAAKVPQGRLAEPAEVAAAIAYLGSDEAAHVTGASLPVDGGYTAA